MRIKKLMCFVFDHNRSTQKEVYGTTAEGQKLYTIAYGKCTRCGKEK
jgi:hypothetical protein